MTTQTSRHGNPTTATEEKLLNTISSLETANKELDRNNWQLTQRAKLTVATVIRKYLAKASKEVTIINLFALGLTLSILSIGLTLLTTITKFFIYLAVMNSRSIVQIAIEKLMPNNFNFIGTFLHDYNFSFAAISALLGLAIAAAIIHSVLTFKLEDLE